MPSANDDLTMSGIETMEPDAEGSLAARLGELTAAHAALAAAPTVEAVLHAAASEARAIVGANRALARWAPPGDEPRVACLSETSGVLRVDLEAPLLDREGHTVGALQLSGRAAGCPGFSRADAALLEHLARMASAALEERRLLRAADDANRAKDEFLSLVSHELRTPLNAMLGWARLLRTGALDASGRTRAVETIERNALAQAQLLEDLLDISRIVSGKTQLELRAQDLVGPIEDALDAVRPAALSKNIRLSSTLDRKLAPVSGDADRLQQVVWNLLVNSIRFTPEGGEVEVRLTREGDEAWLVVRDSGQGIRPDVLPVIFDRFRRARSSGDAKGGLGLGLAIVRHLVELHGGSVHAESPGEGRGATFIVRLPLVAVAAPAPPPSGPVAVRAEPARLDGVRVLVVDDERDARDFVKESLEQSGATVRAVGSVGEALAEIERTVPDVLVSDVAMPGEDGYALMARVRALEGARGGQVPAVALTAYARPADRTRALSAGFQFHLAKPVDPGDLATIVARLAPSRARS